MGILSSLTQVGARLLSWVGTNPITSRATAIIAGQILCRGAEALGGRIFALTGGRVSINRAIPQSIREVCRDIGLFVERHFFTPITDRLERIDEAHPRFERRGYRTTEVTRSLLLAPLVEETLVRGPTIAAFQLADACIDHPLARTAVKVGVTFASATLFTYMHEEKPQPRRAASLFSSGIISVLLSTRFGLGTSIIDHFFYNLLALRGR